MMMMMHKRKQNHPLRNKKNKTTLTSTITTSKPKSVGRLTSTTTPLSWIDVVQNVTQQPNDEMMPRKIVTRSRSITRMTHTNEKCTRTRKLSLDLTPLSDTMATVEKLGSKEDVKRVVDLVNRLGLSTHRFSSLSSCTQSRSSSIHRRPRSASEDTRPCPPLLWVVRQPLSTTIANLQQVRTHRAKSVPDYQRPKNVESEVEDTYSESTSTSSCPSSPHPLPTEPRRTSPSVETMELFAEYMTPDDEADQEEAVLFLTRVNQLSSEFKAHRAYEESTALAWSVQHAATQGIISVAMKKNLLSSIQTGAWEEARDVLYHKCHLIPAVGLLNDSSSTSSSSTTMEENTAFLQCVEHVAPADTAEMQKLKRRVLSILSDLLSEWVQCVGLDHGLSDEYAAFTSGSVYVAGSYRLGLEDPLSDIDVVCAVPWHVTHDDFFTSFCQVLEQTPGVEHLAPVPTAYVPLISLSFYGVNMDLLFSRLPMDCIESKQEIDSDHILLGMDAASMKSLNAPRVSSMLLCLVPKRNVFRMVLRGIRAWARQRGIYSAKLGYLGGISWSILVAFVCQLYPDASPVIVFIRFFQIFSEWPWPRPVMLNIVYDAGLGFEMWDPRQNLYDRAHIMPIITPAYPHMNSAVQISTSTFSVIYEELWRARLIAETAIPRLSKSPRTLIPADVSVIWKQLFERSNFFVRYDFYLIVQFEALTSSSMHVWGQFVRSRLRKLVDSLHHVSGMARVHAHPQFFTNRIKEKEGGECMFIGMEWNTKEEEMKVNLERTIRFFLATDLQQSTHQDMQATVNVLLWSELPEFVFENGRQHAMIIRTEYQEQLKRVQTMNNPILKHRYKHSPST